MPTAAELGWGRGLSLLCPAFCGPTVSSDTHSHVPILRLLPPDRSPVLSHGSPVPGISLLGSMETGEGRPEEEGPAPFITHTRKRGSAGTVGALCRYTAPSALLC